MSRKSSTAGWLKSHINDPYVKLAQQEGYRARSVYKLKEIDEVDDLFNNVSVIVDLGSSPGSWSQYAVTKFKGKIKKLDNSPDNVKVAIENSQMLSYPLIIAVDLLEMVPIPGVVFIQGDFREEKLVDDILLKLGNRKVDLVISDMAPNLSGVRIADSYRASHLCELALDFSMKVLSPHGSLLVKSFHGPGYTQIVSEYKKIFQKVFVRKPKASRDKSSEVFLLGKVFR